MKTWSIVSLPRCNSNGSPRWYAAAIVALTFLFPGEIAAQSLSLLELPENAVVEAPLFEDQQGDLYSTLVIVKFDQHVIDVPKGRVAVALSDVRPGYSAVTGLFGQLETGYGAYTLRKRIPNAVWGDTLRTNKRTGATVTISDYSQIVEVWFEGPVSLSDVKAQFETLDEVAYVEEPQVYYLVDEPDDPEYVNGNQWSLPKIDAARAWDISRGIISSDPIGIAFPDEFPCDLAGSNMHTDLINKLTIVECMNITSQHGYSVAGMAGAETNNGQFVASLGWDVDLYGFYRFSVGLGSIVTALGEPTSPAYGNIDVVQNSWVGGSSPTTEDAVRDLLTMGVVVVGSAGNGQGCNSGVCTSQQYPAAYHFDDIDAGDGTTYEAQVIAVSASFEADSMRHDYTYSPGTNPLTDPERAFIDVAAPGQRVRILTTDINTLAHGVTNGWGTSFAGPLVAAQVALVLSVNPELRVDEVYDIVTRSAEKIDQVRHPDSFFWTDTETGENLAWNQWSGYGRINAFLALKYALEKKGGTLVRSFDVEAGETWNFEPVTVAAPDGLGLGAYGSLNAIGTTFTEAVPGQGWDGLRYHAGSSGILNSVTVERTGGGLSGKYGSAGVVAQDATVTLNACSLIENAGHGLSAIGSGATVSLTDCDVLENAGSGVAFFDQASGSLQSSTLGKNGEAGLLAASYASVDFGTGADGCNTVSRNLEEGIRAISGADIDAGGATQIGGEDYFDHNRFLGNGTYDASAGSGSLIWAERNWWGTTGTPNLPPLGYNNIFYTPQLQSDPGVGCSGSRPAQFASLSAALGEGTSASRGDDTSHDLLRAARAAWMAGDFAGATALLWEVVDEDPEDEFAHVALAQSVGLLRAALEAEAVPAGMLGALADYAEEGPEALQPWALRALTAAHDMLGDDDAALSTAGTLITAHPGNEHERAGRLAAFHVHLGAGDAASAEAALAPAVAQWPEDVEVQAAAWLIGLPVGEASRGEGNGVIAKAGGEEALKSESGATPRELALGAAYPNPFVGEATLELSLPDAAEVRVAVYDVLGRQVGVLADGMREAGLHALRLDGSRLATGTYLVVAAVEVAGSTSPRVLRHKVTLVR